MSETQLAKILDAGDKKKCLRFFRGMSEKERRKLAPYCIKRFRGLEQVIEPVPGTVRINPELRVMAVAMPCVCTAAELKKLGTFGTPDDDTMFAILQDRRPEWTDQWVRSQLDRTRYWQSWPLIHRLSRAALCSKPDHPNYAVGMVQGLLADARRDRKEIDLRKALLADPDLLDHDVWKLFEYDGGAENSLAISDRWKGRSSWGLTLCGLAESGHLSRERLIDCTFDALQRDFNHYRARWFQRFHDALELTDAERVDHRDQYLSLLRLTAAPVVSWAYGHVQQLHRTSPYDAPTLANGLIPVLQSRQKGIVKKALKLLEKTVSDEPKSRSRVATTALVALAHEDAEVQASAFQLIVAFGSPTNKKLASEVSKHEGLVAASLRKELRAWARQVDPKDGKSAKKRKRSSSVGKRPAIERTALNKLDAHLLDLSGASGIAAAIDEGRAVIPAASFDGMDIPRIGSETRIQSITDLDELIDLCARVIEDGSQADEIEQVFDGVSRLCHLRPNDFDSRVGPLKKRAVTLLKREAPPFSGYSSVADVCGLVHSWITAEVISGHKTKDALVYDFGPRTRRYSHPDPNSPLTFLGQRSQLISERAAKRNPSNLLSAPTHQGGWICPQLLVERVSQWSGPDPDTEDVCLAMLRLAPDGRDQALKRLRTPKDEWSKAIKYALGGKRMQIGKSAALWLTAARARSPWCDDSSVAKAFKNKGPDEAVAAKYEIGLQMRKYHRSKTPLAELIVRCDPEPTTSQAPASLFLTNKLDRASPHRVIWAATLWPQARESLFAAGARLLFSNLDWWEAEWGNKEFLSPLTDPDTPLRQMGLLVLSVGLAAKEPGEHGLSTDIAITAIEDGRLGTDNFGPMLAQLIPTGLVKSARLAKTLAEVARVSELHAYVVQQALQGSLRVVPQDPPRDLPTLLELIKELSIELDLAVTDLQCRDYLQQLAGGGKKALLCKQLLELSQDDSQVIVKVQQQSLQHRLARVERWQNRVRDSVSD